jgi:MFS family permease
VGAGGEVSPTPGPREAWRVVALLWFCGFFNYADRQAVFAVFPLLKADFGLTTDAAKGLIGSAFMVVYALASPLTGWIVDRGSRRWLVAAGLGFWSLICALTALARNLPQMLLFRAAEGLGESFYFPASMSLLADHHGPATRSRAMSVHQTSVYAGTAAGGLLAGALGQRLGWQAPFWVLGAAGMAYAAWLATRLREPRREGQGGGGPRSGPSRAVVVAALRSRPLLGLLAAFAGANFVAMALYSWMPDYVYRSFGLDLTGSAAVASLFLPGANLIGALIGGALADRIAARRPGGRALVQAVALMAAAPCVVLVGRATGLGPLVVGLVGIGLAKGIYDANIFAAAFDLVPPEIRGVAAGLMNTIGWGVGSLAPVLVGLASDRIGLAGALSLTGAMYVLSGLAALAASSWAAQAKS